ncbi:MAG: cytidine deaminase [Woeseiaceae bacterium]|nr:cytidine deaminase [Woeseiaceae bacterium]
MTDQELIDLAVEVRDRAYAKYSNYRVGAALVDEHGNVHVGCNVENAAYPQGSCAEAGAISAMVAAGGMRIVAIAVAGGSDRVTACTPCGGCRQRINEFADDETRIIVMDDGDEWRAYSIDELLPHSFQLF